METQAATILGAGNVAAMNLPEAQDLFRRFAAALRDFDSKLAQIPFPPSTASDAQAVISADEHIAAGLDKVAAGCTDACTVWLQTAPYLDIRTKAIQTLRADLGLPPPS